jgi:hypothetical protein
MKTCILRRYYGFLIVFLLGSIYLEGLSDAW